MKEHSNCNFIAYNCIRVIISIIVGFLVAILFSMSLIPVVFNLVKIGFYASILVLAILIFFLALNHIQCHYSPFDKCIRKQGYLLSISTLGTFILTTVGAIAYIVAGSLFSTILLGLIGFFFTLMILSLSGFISCILKKSFRDC